MEPDHSIQGVAAVEKLTNLTRHDFNTIIRQGILTGTGIKVPDKLADDLLEAVCIYAHALTQQGSIEANVLEDQLKEKIDKHKNDLIDYVAALASNVAREQGEKVYIGWFMGGATKQIVGTLVSKIVTIGVNGLIGFIASTAGVPMQSLTDHEVEEFFIVPDFDVWVDIDPGEYGGYSIVERDQATEFVVFTVKNLVPGDLTQYIKDDYDPATSIKPHPHPQQPEAQSLEQQDEFLSLSSDEESGDSEELVAYESGEDKKEVDLTHYKDDEKKVEDEDSDSDWKLM